MTRSVTRAVTECSASFELLRDRAGRVLLVRFGALFSQRTIAALDDAARRVVACHGNLPVILDFSQVGQFAVDLRAWRDVARRRRVIRDAPRVLVAAQDSVFGLLRIYATLQTDSGDPTMVVRSLSEACSYLGLSNPDFRPLAGAELIPKSQIHPTSP